MKKNIIYLFTLVISAIFIFSCGGDKKISEDNIDLSYTFEKGDKFSYKLTTIATTEETVQADSTMKVNSKQTDSYVMDFEVIDVDADKIAEMNVTISTIKLDAESNGQKLNFDAAANPSKEEQQKFWQYAIQYNTPFRARVNSKGEVIEVSRLDKMIDKMNSLQPERREISAAEKTKLSQELGEGIIRPLTQLIFRELPNKTMAKDSSWEKIYPGQLSVFKVNNLAVFKIEDIVDVNGDDNAKVSVNLSVTWEGEKQGEQQGVRYNFEDPKISGNGSILFNLEKGILTKSETLTNVELVANIESMNALQKKMKTVRKDLSSNKNTVELIEK